MKQLDTGSGDGDGDEGGGGVAVDSNLPCLSIDS